MHPNCLDLDPQDGDIDLIEELERHFGFVPTQEKVGRWLTLGDVHATLEAEIAIRREGACPSLRAFNLLRQALLANGSARQSLQVETALDFIADGRPASLLHRLGKQTGLRMPSSRYAAAGRIGGILFLVGFIGSIALLLNGLLQVALVLFLLLVSGAGLMWTDKGRWPPGMTTLGDLAGRVAALNHKKLADVRDLPDTLWQRLTAFVAEYSEMPTQSMRADTLLFAPLRERPSSRQ